jgi:8-oxo-dGTP diphosphatase
MPNELDSPGSVNAKVTADLVILTIREGRLKVLLIVRGRPPFAGMLALPGGFLEPNETLWDTAERELHEETGILGGPLHLELVGVYSEPNRDPRGRIVTASFLAVAPNLGEPVAGLEAESANWYDVKKALGEPLAFDHSRIIVDALDRARSLLEHTTIAATFCDELFTIRDLQDVYEAVWDVTLDPGNFQKKIAKREGFVEETGSTRKNAFGRPAALYRKGPATTLQTAIFRPSAMPGWPSSPGG